MSVYALVISLALAGQVADGDRYGAPPSQPATAPVQSPFGSSPRRNVSPPPPIVPETSAPPAMTAEDYGYNAAATRSAAPPSPPATINFDGTNNLDNAKPSSERKPAVMMQAMLTAPAGSRLTGRPVRLAEVLAGASTRPEKSERIEAYWDLCSSVADYYLGVREQDELQRLRTNVATVGPAWQQAESELGVRIGTSERAAVASQYRLASLMGNASALSLPLPVDLPHCGDYYARYDQVFAGRESPEAKQLSELLPMRYEELSDAAEAVTRAEEFLGAIAAQRSGGDGTGTLRGLELLALRRRAFVQIARDYNRRIARYAELSSPGPIDTDRLIGMLIKRDAATDTARRPATQSPPPNRQSQLQIDREVQPANLATTGTDQTFAEGWESIKSTAAATPRDEELQPASVEAQRAKPRREHSLLVPSE